ncbi:PKD domain-containing protein [Reichenbachiella agarivorans]|uniref:PKD domain-containing protein n=1 Tax=Reichenbachiella agarivorans TaxID=2979464 RepID=A0ABY6CNV6_9BACT|nr:PKD domain-containing protein [Reichenbachiella agarivorans]UXP32059.1 PKD domain-containing protein [Reichenbachiella agarivorans]
MLNNVRKKWISLGCWCLVAGLIAFLSSCEKEDEGTGEESGLIEIRASQKGIMRGGTVLFADSSTKVSQREWLFAGGKPETSTDATVTVQYDSAGLFKASLRVTYTNGETELEEVTIRVVDGLTAGFSVDQDSVIEYSYVQFSDTTIGTADEWIWEFEGGEPATSTDRQPMVHYKNVGMYDVKLIVKQNGEATNMDTVLVSDYIEVVLAPALVPEYEVDKVAPIEYEYVQFTDLTEGGAETYYWEFEGGQPATSTEANPRVLFTSAGNFEVTLRMTRTEPERDETLVSDITVGLAPEITADFSANVTLTPFGSQVTFTQTSSDNADGWFWEFEGGTPATSTEKKPTVTYSTIGVYDVKLTVTGTEPDRETVVTKTDYMTVTDPLPPVADFTSDYNNTLVFLAGGVIAYTDESLNDATSYLWEFEGGTPATSTDANPTVTYNTAGTYDVKLTATNDLGSDTKTLTNHVVVSSNGSVCDDSPANLIACGNYDGESDDLSGWRAARGATFTNTDLIFNQMDHLGISSTTVNGGIGSVTYEMIESNGLVIFVGSEFTVDVESSYTFTTDIYAETLGTTSGNMVVELAIIPKGTNDSNLYRAWQAPADMKDKWSTKSMNKILPVGTYVVGYRLYGGHSKWHFDNLKVVKN